MRRIADFTPKKVTAEPDFSLAKSSLDDLKDRAREILRREITNLMVESTGRKLSPTSSASLVSYIKLIDELKKQEDTELRALSDAHLEKLAE